MTVETFVTNNFTNQEKLELAWNLLEENSKEETVSYDDVLETLHRVFGNKATLEKRDFLCLGDSNKIIYRYDSNNNIFNRVESSCIGEITRPVDVVNSLFSAKKILIEKQEKIVVIQLRRSFAQTLGHISNGSQGLYRYETFKDSWSGKNQLDNFTKEAEKIGYSEFLYGLTNAYIIRAMEKHIDDYAVHTYIFNYEEGGYNLESLSVEDLPNKDNNSSNNNRDDNIENPMTGDYTMYLLGIGLVVIIIVGFPSYKLRKK